MKLNDQILKEVEAELDRFKQRLVECRQRMSSDKYAVSGCKQTASLRRGALDLKNELTKITTSKAY